VEKRLLGICFALEAHRGATFRKSVSTIDIEINFLHVAVVTKDFAEVPAFDISGKIAHK